MNKHRSSRSWDDFRRVHDADMLLTSGSLWREAIDESVKYYREAAVDLHVENACRKAQLHQEFGDTPPTGLSAATWLTAHKLPDPSDPEFDAVLRGLGLDPLTVLREAILETAPFVQRERDRLESLSNELQMDHGHRTRAGWWVHRVAVKGIALTHIDHTLDTLSRHRLPAQDGLQ